MLQTMSTNGRGKVSINGDDYVGRVALILMDFKYEYRGVNIKLQSHSDSHPRTCSNKSDILSVEGIIVSVLKPLKQQSMRPGIQLNKSQPCKWRSYIYYTTNIIHV